MTCAKKKDDNYWYLNKFDAEDIFNRMDEGKILLPVDLSFLGKHKARRMKFTLTRKSLKKIKESPFCCRCGLKGNMFYVVCTTESYPNQPHLRLFYENEKECVLLAPDWIEKDREVKLVCQRCHIKNHQSVIMSKGLTGKKEVINGQFICWKKYNTEEIFSLVGKRDHIIEKIFYEPTKQTFDFVVSLKRKKLGIFKKNPRCVKCKKEGNVIRLVSQINQEIEKSASLQLFYENRETNTKQLMTLDHIVPVARGGFNAGYNLQTMCEICNNEKADML